MLESTLQGRLQRIFRQHAERVAIESGDRVISYRELHRSVDRVAQLLKQQGIERQSFVGVYLADRANLIVCLLGILQAGCVFVPLDPAYPPERTARMLEAAEITVVLTDSSGREQLSTSACRNGCELLAVESWLEGDGTVESVAETQAEEALADDPIYVYFTSGTTGLPKPIIGRNGSLLHFIDWEIEFLAMEQPLRVSQLTPPGHDPFLRDVFLPLCSGGTVCLLEDSEILWQPLALRRWIERSGVQIIHCTPSLFAFLQPERSADFSFPQVRSILLAGEKINPQQLARWYEQMGTRIQLVNLYGPTETTLAKFYHPISPADLQGGNIPIGKPIKGARAVVVDEQMRLCAPGMVGELLIRTPYRTYGYYKQPEWNREKFVPNPFSNDPQDLVYRTGDLARLLPDGNYELLGRADRQIKIRGFRVELEEVEHALNAHPDVRQALVVERENREGQQRLCAYLLLEPSVVDFDSFAADLKRFIQGKLPDYMWPSQFYRLETLPLGQNGKLDYKSLPALEDQEMPVAEAAQGVEQKLSALWETILGVTPPGFDVSFFEMGGHSLHVMSLIAGIYEQFRVELPLMTIFQTPTIRGLADYIQSQAPAQEFSVPQQSPPREFYPVSSAQRRLLILQQFENGQTNYNIPSSMVIEGPLDRERFASAFRQLIRRHETLRTSFRFQDRDFVQVVQEDVPFAIEYEENVSDPVDEIVKAFVRPFDLAKAPLLRVKLTKLAEDRHLFLFDIHHLVADGVSMAVLIEEFAEFYEGRELPALPFQYKEYVEQSIAREVTEVGRQQEAFWREQFAKELRPLALYTDFARPLVPAQAGDVYRTVLTPQLTAQLQSLAQNAGCTLYMVLLSAYLVWLSRFAEAEDVCVGTPVSGRRWPGVEKLIGMFVNTVAIRAYPNGFKRFDEFLPEVRKVALDSFEQQDFPFEKLVDLLELPRDLSRHPLFDTMFNYLDVDYKSKLKALSDIRILPLDREQPSAKFDLSVVAQKEDDAIGLACTYKSQLYRKDTVQFLLEEYVHLLEQIVRNPKQKLEAYDLFDRNRLPSAETASPVPPQSDRFVEFAKEEIEQSIGRRFEAIVELYPERIAIRTPDRTLTYRALNEAANRVAAALAGEAGRVALLLEHPADRIIGMFGALKAGLVYIPLDPAYPSERLAEICEDAEPDVILTERALADAARQIIGRTAVEAQICLLEAASDRSDNLDLPVAAEQPAYLLYTSGSTGKPKGVIQTHRNVLHFIRVYTNRLRLSADDKLTQFSTYCFDASVMDIFGALLNGATLYPCSIRTSGMRPLIEWLHRERVTVFHAVPSLYRILVDALSDELTLPHVRLVVLGGEAVYRSDVESYKRCFSDSCLLINGLGPTESTVALQQWVDKQTEIRRHRVAVGRPVEETTVRLITTEGREAAVFATGEIVLQSRYLAPGYWRRQEATDRAFLQAENGMRQYRSGDLGRYLPDGTIEFVGRLDDQVKIRGYRVELGEIEHVLLAHPQVVEAAVVLANPESAEGRVIACIVAKDQLLEAETRAYLEERLPSFMVPSQIVQLDSMPRTRTGKIDKQALRTLPMLSSPVQNATLPPATEWEALLVQIWEKTLGVNPIGVEDHFFAIGGNSLLTIAVEVELERVLQVEDLNLSQQIIKHSTIRELARELEAILERRSLQ